MKQFEKARDIIRNEGFYSLIKKIWGPVHRRFYKKKYLVRTMKRIYKPDPYNRRLNIGAGNWYYPRWENIDLYADKFYIDYELDLRTKTQIPVLGESAEIIFSSHLFEHLPDEDCLFIFQECYRMLKPTGLFRIAVPDQEKAFAAYKNNDHLFFDKGGVRCVGDTIEQKLVNYFASYSMGNYHGGPQVSAEEVQAKLRELDQFKFCRWCVAQIPVEAPL